MFDADTLKVALPVVSFATSNVLAIAFFVLNRQWAKEKREIAARELKATEDAKARKDTDTKIQALLDKHQDQLVRIDERLKHMPDAEELAHLGGEMKGIKSQMDSMEKGLHAIKSQLDIINEHLLNNR